MEHRSKGCCEAELPGCRHKATDIHHRKLRRFGDHTPINLLHLCGNCHLGQIHGNTGWAYRHGWLVRQDDDPKAVDIVPTCTPSACLCDGLSDRLSGT